MDDARSLTGRPVPKADGVARLDGAPAGSPVAAVARGSYNTRFVGGFRRTKSCHFPKKKKPFFLFQTPSKHWVLFLRPLALVVLQCVYQAVLRQVGGFPVESDGFTIIRGPVKFSLVDFRGLFLDISV